MSAFTPELVSVKPGLVSEFAPERMSDAGRAERLSA
jgi:hypothetical protein